MPRRSGLNGSELFATIQKSFPETKKADFNIYTLITDVKVAFGVAVTDRFPSGLENPLPREVTKGVLKEKIRELLMPDNKWRYHVYPLGGIKLTSHNRVPNWHGRGV